MSEKRVDPAYGEAYTFDEISAFYKGKYKKNQIKAYWDNECTPLKKKGKEGKEPKAKAKSNNKKKDKDAANEESKGVPVASTDKIETARESTTPHIEGIFITPCSAAPMQPLEVGTLIKGVGIEGDRYALGTGTYSAAFLKEPGKNLTVISADAVEAEMAKVGMEPLPMGDMRRNLVVRGLSAETLNDMVGHEVTVGSSCRLFVHRRTVPCKYREAQVKRPMLMDKLWDVCGVNCEILEGGDVHVGDSVAVVPDTHQPKRCDPGMKPAPFFIRPSERTPEQVKQMVIPSFVAMIAVLWDPVGFQRLEDGYRSAGVNFFSVEAYDAAMRTKRCVKPAAYLTVAATVGVAAAIFMKRRK